MIKVNDQFINPAHIVCASYSIEAIKSRVLRSITTEYYISSRVTFELVNGGKITCQFKNKTVALSNEMIAKISAAGFQRPNHMMKLTYEDFMEEVENTLKSLSADTEKWIEDNFNSKKEEIPIPKAPCNRLRREADSSECPFCGSSLALKWGFFKKDGCIQPECENFEKTV